jgi:S-adenosylmethionine decarboxylase
MKQVLDAHEFRGKHIYADIYDLESDEVGDPNRLRATLAEAIAVCGANICGLIDKSFEPQGFTCLYLLEESHASIHTYPEQGAIFFDAFTCGRLDPGLILDHFVKQFRNARVVAGRLERGNASFLSGAPLSSPLPHLDAAASEAGDAHRIRLGTSAALHAHV